MASLLRQGREMKGQALAGLGQVADVESRQNIAEEQLKMAKEAQEQQLYGTAIGLSTIAAQPAIAKAMTSKAGAGAIAKSGATIGAAAPYVALSFSWCFYFKQTI